MNIRTLTNSTADRQSVKLLSLAVFVVVANVPAHAQVAFQASWEPRTYEQVREEVMGWVDDAPLTEEIRLQARSLWPAANLRAGDGSSLLERVAETFALANPAARELFEACNTEFAGPIPPDADWLADESLPKVLRYNLRLYYARWLTHHQLYDEVLEALAEIAPSEVVDPAGLLFYRMIAHHQLVEPDESRLALEKLMEQEDRLPRRYLQVAQLLRRDLAGLKDESLDHVARRMNDVRRRLDIGRAGKQVQVVEKGVVDSLDRMIKKLEQQQQQQQQISQPGGSNRSSKPMPDSQLPSGGKPPMKVDQRDIGNQSGWGDLPAKEREQALQQIGREYPAHYRELIEQYFRELADETNSDPTK